MTNSDRSPVPAFRQALTRVFPRHSNANWLNIAAMLADMAFETDQFGRFTACGQTVVLGYPAAALIGRNIADFCTMVSSSSRTSGSFSAIFAGLGQSNDSWRGIVTVRRGDGSYGNFQIVLAPKPADDTSAKPRKATPTTAGVYGLLIDMAMPDLLIQRPEEKASTGMLDAQTGLWSAATFAEETGRRFDRLDVEGTPGTLILLAFSNAPLIGYPAVAASLAQELRDICRPTDIIGRLDATTFALWCDGMDDLTGAERAARFCERLPHALPGNPRISVGLVARWRDNFEEPSALIEQARAALSQAQLVAEAAASTGSVEPPATGTWRVWNPRR